MSECLDCIRRSRMVLQTLFQPEKQFMTCNLGHELFIGNCEDFCSDPTESATGDIECLQGLLADKNAHIEKLEGAVGALKAQLIESQREARQSEYRRRRTAESATGQIRKIEYLEELLAHNKKEIEALKSELAAKAAEDAGQADGFELGCRLPLMTADESRRLYEELLADKNRKIEALESELIGKECDILEMTETLDAHFALIRQALKMLAMLDPAPESEGGADV